VVQLGPDFLFHLRILRVAWRLEVAFLVENPKGFGGNGGSCVCALLLDYLRGELVYVVVFIIFFGVVL
jgi:hypothetical protein